MTARCGRSRRRAVILSGIKKEMAKPVSQSPFGKRNLKSQAWFPWSVALVPALYSRRRKVSSARCTCKLPL